MEELIPGLPNDVAEECLIRAHYVQFPVLNAVCRRWSRFLHSTDYLLRRRLATCSNPLMASFDQHQIKLYDLSTGKAHVLPTLLRHSVYRITTVRNHIIAIDSYGGKVSVYDFFTSNWRQGATMPCLWNNGFACVSDGLRRVFVGGRQVNPDNGERANSAMVYDMDEDKWDVLPKRPLKFVYGQLSVGFHNGVFYLDGFNYDTSSGLWKGEPHTLPSSKSTAAVVAHDGKVYRCEEKELVVFVDSGLWNFVVRLPHSLGGNRHLMPWKDGLLLVGDYAVYTLAMEGIKHEDLRWKIEWAMNSLHAEFFHRNLFYIEL